MQLSYNIIKKHQADSNTVYTVKAPLIQLRTPAFHGESENSESIEDVKANAENIINDALQKSQYIINTSMEEAENIKKNAYEAAFKKGYAEGVAKGKSDGFASVDGLRNEARDVLNEAHRVSREYIDKNKGEIINLSLYISQKIIGYQADVNDSIIFEIVKGALSSAVLREQVIIKVNPMDYAIIDCRREELIKAAGEDIIINIIKDDEIKRGGCILDTGASSVDATIDAQLEKIKAALLGL